MKELGGYFELELNQGEHFHKDALALNSARNCLKYILRAQKPSKTYVPAYSCDSLIEPLISESIPVEYYHINFDFELEQIPTLKKDEKFIYINYFGLKSDYVKKLYDHLGSQLIVDNTQAFYEMPLDGVDTFYSPRKFFGVSDGGYLYTKIGLDEKFEQDYSSLRVKHLTGRYEKNASEFLSNYQMLEKSLIEQPIKWMSPLTAGILKSLDYEKIGLTRQRNFWVLHSILIKLNPFELINFNNFVPMGYPLFSNSKILRNKLTENKIYTAKYWQDASERVDNVEKELIENLVLLPIDQRVGIHDLSVLIELIELIKNEE